jgi:hypothetical protein
MARKIPLRTIDFIKTFHLSLTLRGLNKTAQWVELLLTNLLKGNPSNYKEDFYDIENSFTNELSNVGSYPITSFLNIRGIFLHAVKKELKPLLENVFPYIEDYMKSWKNIISLQNILTNPDLNKREKFYLNCFIYLLVIEGLFRPWIRVLYYLLYNIEKGEIKLEQINDDNIRNLIIYMEKKGVDSVIFEPYKNGYLRNAIAHSHFTYDEQSDKMLFECWDGSELIWSNGYTLDEFIRETFKITLFSDLCLDMIFLLRLHDLLFVYLKV